MNREIISFLKAALECSVFVAPLEPGLTYEELIEIGKRADYQPGEIGDALRFVTNQHFGQKRLLPDQGTTASWIFLRREDPDYRNFDAFDFVVAELNSLARAEGAAKAQLQRGAIVERAVARGIPRHDIEVAIAYQVMANILTEKDGMIRFPNNHGARGLPGEQLSTSRGNPIQKPDRRRAFPIVKDVIERRTDGRPGLPNHSTLSRRNWIGWATLHFGFGGPVRSPNFARPIRTPPPSLRLSLVQPLSKAL